MGYSCSKAALRTLGAIKVVLGANEPASNVIRLSKRLSPSCVDVERPVAIERGREQADGAITGTLVWLETPYQLSHGKRSRSVVRFRINADGTIAQFPSIGGVTHMKIFQLVRDANFNAPTNVI